LVISAFHPRSQTESRFSEIFYLQPIQRIHSKFHARLELPRCHTPHQERKKVSFNHEQFDSRDYHPTDPRSTGEPAPSSNAANHGRSQKFILRHEDPAEYEALHKKWWDEYRPANHTEETLVQLLIDNHWLFKRARLRLEQVEWEMPLNAKHWTDAYRKQVDTFTRFKTTAERAFQRSFREVELYFRECVRSENMAHKAELMRLKIDAQIARKPEEVIQIAIKMATPLYRDRRDLIAARAKLFPPSSSQGP
jgi:hypothetical protein